MKVAKSLSGSRYVLDETSKRVEFDGESYAVKKMPGKRVMMLADQSKLKQSEIESRLQPGSTAYDVPIEVLYSGNRFAGYLFNEYVQVDTPYIDPMPVKPVSDSILENTAFKIICSVVITLLLGILQLYVLHPYLVGHVYLRATSGIANACLLITKSGYTGLVLGTILTIFVTKKLFDNSFFVILGAQIGGYIGLILALGFLMRLIFSIFSGLLSIVIGIITAILPTIIVIVVVVYIVKSFFKR